jgi:hypothetical protein
MSTPSLDTHAAGHGHGVRSEEDRVPVARVAMVGVVSLAIFFVGSFLAVQYLRMRQAERGPVAVPAEIGQSKIGLVEQQPFALSLRADRLRAQQLQRLGSLGWVDRQTGVAHIPIEEAMRLVVAGVRPPSAPAGTVGGQP